MRNAAYISMSAVYIAYLYEPVLLHLSTCHLLLLPFILGELVIRQTSLLIFLLEIRIGFSYGRGGSHDIYILVVINAV